MLLHNFSDMNSKAFAWVTYFLVVFLFCCSTSSVGKTDVLPLLAIKEEIQGGLRSWNQSVPYCQWQGILCSKLHRERIIALNLSSQGLVGSLSPHIGNLSFLRVLDLRNNMFHGKIPREIGNDFKALVFEFMPNGSVETWLHPCGSGQENQPRNLNLLQRLNIASDVASALNYLHNQCHISIIHRDLKPSNVLLDNDMVTHVGDFGLAKLLPASDNVNPSTSTGVKGSIGYVPPEYGMGGAASTQGDVYSYGILLLELFTGRRPTDEMFTEGSEIHNFAKSALSNRIQEIVDPVLVSEEQEEEAEAMQECIASVFRIGVTCSVQSPGERMNIEEVEKELHSIKDRFIDFLDRNEG